MTGTGRELEDASFFSAGPSPPEPDPAVAKIRQAPNIKRGFCQATRNEGQAAFARMSCSPPRGVSSKLACTQVRGRHDE